jgi:hypothetical protein
MHNNMLSKIVFVIGLLVVVNARSQEVTETLTKVADEYSRNSDLFFRARSNKTFVIRGLLSNYTTISPRQAEEVIVVIAPDRDFRNFFTLVCPLSSLADRDHLDKLVVGKDEIVLSGTFTRNLASRSVYSTLGSGVVLEGVDCRVRN